jgi:hypothetical protein
VVAREAAEDAAEERCAAGASIIGRAAKMALRLLRGCRASEETTGTAAAGGLESEAIVAGGLDTGREEAKAWAAITGWVFMLRVDTEVVGCRGQGCPWAHVDIRALRFGRGRELGAGWAQAEE